jgi:uncharacterized Zn finger protein
MPIPSYRESLFDWAEEGQHRKRQSKAYLVKADATTGTLTCSCEAFGIMATCKHVAAVLLHKTSRSALTSSVASACDHVARDTALAVPTDD